MAELKNDWKKQYKVICLYCGNFAEIKLDMNTDDLDNPYGVIYFYCENCISQEYKKKIKSYSDRDILLNITDLWRKND